MLDGFSVHGYVFVLTDRRTNICSYENKKFLALEITRQFTIFVECPSLNFNLKRYLKLHQLQVYLKVESLLMLFSALRYNAFDAAAVTYKVINTK